MAAGGPQADAVSVLPQIMSVLLFIEHSWEVAHGTASCRLSKTGYLRVGRSRLTPGDGWEGGWGSPGSGWGSPLPFFEPLPGHLLPSNVQSRKGGRWANLPNSEGDSDSGVSCSSPAHGCAPRQSRSLSRVLRFLSCCLRAWPLLGLWSLTHRPRSLTSPHKIRAPYTTSTSPNIATPRLRTAEGTA